MENEMTHHDYRLWAIESAMNRNPAGTPITAIIKEADAILSYVFRDQSPIPDVFTEAQ